MANPSSVSLYVVAAICGCWRRESNVNPGVWESLTPTTWDHEYQFDGIGGYGLGQWTNVGSPHGRLWNLHNWVNANGYGDGNGTGQVAFMLYEDYWTNSSQTIGAYTNLEEYLETTETNLEILVRDFMANWEGVAGSAIEERLGYAINFLTYITAHQNDSPTDFNWTSSNNYLTEQQMNQNTMCIYFQLAGGYVPPVPTKRKGMPLWMMLRYFP